MRELTYCQDLILQDEGILNGLVISSEKIWLPNREIVELMLQAAEDCEKEGEESPVSASKLRQALEADKRVDTIVKWEETHSSLFNEGIIERLPRALEGEEEGFIEDLNFRDVWGDWKPGITTENSLHGVLAIRNVVPGAALFETNKTLPSDGSLTAARVLTVNIPTLPAAPIDEVLKMRERAHTQDIKAFWEMIDYYSAQSTPSSAVQKIQEDIKKWHRENLSLRGGALATGALAALCFVNPVFLPAAAVAGTNFLSNANIRWAERDLASDKGFRFMSSLFRG